MAESVTDLASLDAFTRWQPLERHLKLGVGFSFVFIAVEDEDSVAELAQFLRSIFAQSESPLRVFSPPLPDLVYSLPELILGAPATQMTAATLVVGNNFRGRHGHREWENAWHYTVARLNERRDVLRLQLQAPLIFAGPTWLMLLLRDQGPDLWSARALVLRYPTERQNHSVPSPQVHSSEDSIEDLIRRTSLVDLMERFRAFPQPLSPATLLGWREREVALVLSRLHQRRLRHTTEQGDGLLNAVLAAAWCVGAHRDGEELSRLLEEAKQLLDPRGPSGLALSMSARRDFWPQYLALDSWHSALTCNWSQAGQTAQEAISASELFISDANAPLSADALAGASLAREIVIISRAMTGNERLRERLGRTEPARPTTDFTDKRTGAFAAQRQLEHGLWMLAHRRFHEAEKNLKSFYHRSQSSSPSAGGSEVFVFLKQSIIVCLLAQRRLHEAEVEAERLAACLHPESTGIRQFVHGNYILFVVHLLCRRKGAAKTQLLHALRLIERCPSDNEGGQQVLRLLLMYAALFDGDIFLFQSIVETMQQQSDLVTRDAWSHKLALWGMRNVPGLATWISYSFWCSQYVEFLEQTQDFSGGSLDVLTRLKLYAYKSLSVGWRIGKGSSSQPRK